MIRLRRLLSFLLVVVTATLVRGDDAEVRKRVVALDADKKDELRRQRQRFEKLDKAEKQRLRKLHADIDKHPQSKQLRLVMNRYYEWLRSLSPTVRAELRDLAPKERIRRIRQIMKQQEFQRFRRLADDPLPKSDLKLLVRWVEKFIEQNEQQLVERLFPQERARQRLRRLPNPVRRRALAFALVRPVRNNGPRGAGARLRMQLDDARKIRKRLSPEAQRRLAAVANPARQRMLIYKWTRAAVVSHYVPLPDRSKLRRFYSEELTATDRERLENMAPDAMRRELRRMYYNYRMKRDRRRRSRRGP